MRMLFRRLLLLGALAGAVAVLRRYLEREGGGEEVAELTFEDGSSRVLAGGSVEGREISEVARKLVELGL
ncbi:hypothetical protein RxyAA322_14990 [Rubrobacter xylanophilus]|uniref:Uncharacterized protein n=1 Tax=Rubrobacter xylanophilus TaxID=49319 RepID=A0A510HK30_9ACTN|nr:hypothetical protein [Rubrobacter xylanophilus]BBL79645.1 hypothetical protein RxyAA322_14990 [Rubrobacter xylanophilus]